MQAINSGLMTNNTISRFKEGGLVEQHFHRVFTIHGDLPTSRAFKTEDPPLFQGGGLVGSPPINISNILPTPEAPTATAIPAQITVNVSGNVLSQDYVEGELAEAIKEAARRGTDFGLS